MPYGLYLSADGAHTQSKRLDVIAHNLANVDTVGFKRELAIFQARQAEATQRGEDYFGSGSVNDVGGGVEVVQTKTDFSAGPFKNTGVKTDLAIRGDAFFVVQKDDQNFLTRAGNFHVNNQGELLTQYGEKQYAVVDEKFSPIVINRADPNWEFTPTGQLRQGGTIQDLALVKPESLGDLARVGQNLFRPLGEFTPVPPGERQVAVGFLEGSGVQPTTEMIEMIETSRAVEANVNMMKAQDEMLSGLISRVMRV